MEMEIEKKAKRYNRIKRILSIAGIVLNLAFLLFLIFSGLSIGIRNLALRLYPNPYISVLIYMVIAGGILEIISLPIDFYSGYIIEHRYGLSNQSISKWIKDLIKGLLVSVVIGGIIIETIYFTIMTNPDRWWLYTGIIFIGFYLLMTNLAPVILLPLFFKFEPITEGTLKDRLQTMAESVGLKVRGVFKWGLGEKTKKANAGLMGIGNTRRIVLADTLLSNFTEDEILTVFAHELGHHVRRHIPKGILLEVCLTFIGFFLADYFLGRFSTALGFSGKTDMAVLPLLALVFIGLSLILLPAMNAMSRYFERQADTYALETSKDPDAFISSFNKLAELNLADRQPNPIIEFIFYSHPSIEKRIRMAEQYQRRDLR